MKKIYVNGDTSPTWVLRVRRNNKAQNLTGCTLSLKVKLSDATTVTKTPTITDAPNGLATVTFSATDLDIQGRATAELIVTFSGGAVQHARLPFVFYVRNEHEDPNL